MSDTPRTDAELKWHEQSARSDAAGTVSGLIMFARELECENALLREALRTIGTKCGYLPGNAGAPIYKIAAEALRDTEAK